MDAKSNLSFPDGRGSIYLPWEFCKCSNCVETSSSLAVNTLTLQHVWICILTSRKDSYSLIHTLTHTQINNNSTLSFTVQQINMQLPDISTRHCLRMKFLSTFKYTWLIPCICAVSRKIISWLEADSLLYNTLSWILALKKCFHCKNQGTVCAFNQKEDFNQKNTLNNMFLHY